MFYLIVIKFPMEEIVFCILLLKNTFIYLAALDLFRIIQDLLL